MFAGVFLAYTAKENTLRASKMLGEDDESVGY